MGKDSMAKFLTLCCTLNPLLKSVHWGRNRKGGVFRIMKGGRGGAGRVNPAVVFRN